MSDRTPVGDSEREGSQEEQLSANSGQFFEKPPSYTDRMISHLCKILEDDCDLQQMIEQIRIFSKKVAKERKEKEEAKSGPLEHLLFGKYKGKKIEDVAKFDIKYLMWLRRQSFIRPNLKEALDKVLKKSHRGS